MPGPRRSHRCREFFACASRLRTARYRHRSQDQGASCFRRDAIAKLHRGLRMNSGSAVRFGPGEMERQYYPGEVVPEDRFAVATPSYAPRRECLWLMAAVQRKLTAKTARKMRQCFA